MTNEESWVLAYVCDRSGGARHAILIDPADQPPEIAAKRAIAAASSAPS